ncbi:MAG: hypothetical protein ACJ8IK_05295 [Burkholderiaceae bacterium]
MIKVTATQWAMFEDDRARRFRHRLIQFIEDKFGRPALDSGLRTPGQVAEAALEFAAAWARIEGLHQPIASATCRPHCR